MKKEDIKFQISQLRLEKIIYGVEAVAINTICIFVYIFSKDNFIEPALSLCQNSAIILSIGYTLFMGVTNFNRLHKIKKLEKLLWNQIFTKH